MKALALIVFLVATSLVAAEQKVEAPGDKFVDAYMAFQRAEKLEMNGAVAEAVVEYEKADNILRFLRAQHPDWQKAIVDYRHKKVTAALGKLRGTPREAAATEPRVPGPRLRVPNSPLISPSQSVPENWRQFEFNGLPWFVVPLALRSNAAR